MALLSLHKRLASTLASILADPDTAPPVRHLINDFISNLQGSVSLKDATKLDARTSKTTIINCLKLLSKNQKKKKSK
jgi:hypothetical protein